MHPKDENTGYCKVDDCNHPHEGEGACCPKPSSEPSKPTETDVNGLNGTVKVTCMLNDREVNTAHAFKTYALASGGYQINDDMKWDDTFGWIASITVDKNVYIQKYIDELKLPHMERGSLSSQFGFSGGDDSKWEFKVC